MMREILKAFFKTGSGQVGNMLFGAIAMKIMAVILGPSGIGLYSLLRQVLAFTSRVGDAGNSAVVQGLASRKGRGRDAYLVTSFWVFVLGALVLIVVLLISAPWLALWVIGRDDTQTIKLVRWLALPIALTIASVYLQGVLNSFRAIGLLALLQILGAAAMALLAYPVSRLVEMGYPIAFICVMSASPAVGVVLGLWSALRAGWLTPLLHGLRAGFHTEALRHFLSLAGTLLTTGSVATVVGLATQALIVNQEGLASAGIFAVALTLTGTYVMVYVVPFSTYYLPTLSQAEDPLERAMLTQRVLRLTTLVMVPLVMSVIALKPLVVELLYSKEFTPSLEIIRWMLISDYFRIFVFVFDVQLMAYANIRVLLWASTLWSVGSLLFAAVSLFGFSSLQGIGIGFLLLYIIRLAYYLYYTRSRYQLPLARTVVVPWLVGLALVLGVSWYTWSDTQVNWFTAPLWVGAAVGFSWLSINRNERREMLHMALRWKETRQ